MKNIVTRIDDPVKIRNILVSVSDKSGLDTFIPGLVTLNPHIRIYSTGGTYKSLQEILGEGKSENLASVSDYTGQPEMQGGLVKTLDFKIYLGLLSETYNPSHRDDLNRTGSVEMDMVVVNLYPFQDTVSREGISMEEARSNIDIGGPCLIRAAAKNFLRVASVCDPGDYPGILTAMEKSGGVLGLETRFQLAKKAFKHTAVYDRAIDSYLSGLSFPEVQKNYF